jgi:uncharacterized protein involved in exopolysaccharide biosynthesis
MTAGVAGIGNSWFSRRLVRAGNPDGPREETSLVSFLTILLVHRRVIAVCALLGTIVFGILASTQAALFVSRSSFLVRSGKTSVTIPGGGGTLGFSLGAYLEFSQSVAFYADLGRAMPILRRVAAMQYTTSDSNTKRSLAEAMGIKDKNPAVALERAAIVLRDQVTYSISTRTGVVRLSVQANDPIVAQQVNANILAELDRWSKTEGHHQAMLERQFVEQLVADARAKLAQAETTQRSFLETNRMFASSPELRLEAQRLERDVGMRQQIYTALAQTYEQARIEENRVPTILNVVETADLPVEPQRREALRKTLIGLVTGLLVGMVIAVIQQRVEEKKALAF